MAGGISSSGGVILNNCIVAANTISSGSGADINKASGYVFGFGANLIGSNATVTTEFPASGLVGQSGSLLNPLLGSLASNGGPTKTMKLLTGSPALNAVPLLSILPGIAKDQRGFLRKVGPSSDLGAVEFATSVADLNSDGIPDLLFQNTAGQIAMWFMSGSGTILSATIPYAGGLADWRIMGIGDMNNDGNTDLLFQNTAGQVAVWYMNGSGGLLSSVLLYSGALGDWRIVGVGDMNNDGNIDIVFQNSATQLAVWNMNGSGGIVSATVLYAGGTGDWRVVRVADMNNDGNTDLLFQNSSGQLYVWYLNGAAGITSTAFYYGGKSVGDWGVR